MSPLSWDFTKGSGLFGLTLFHLELGTFNSAYVNTPRGSVLTHQLDKHTISAPERKLVRGLHVVMVPTFVARLRLQLGRPHFTLPQAVPRSGAGR
jgi:hypothetical protein